MKSIDNSGNYRTLSPELSICPILKQHNKTKRIAHTGIFLILAVFLALMLAGTASAITAEIGNARAVIYPVVEGGGTTIERSVLVINRNNISVDVKIEADKSSVDIVDVIDSEFVLEPGESREAAFDINLEKAGDYEARVNVFFKSSNGTGSSVVLSSVVIIKASGSMQGDGSDNAEGLNEGQTTSAGGVINLKKIFNKDNSAVLLVSFSTGLLAIVLILLLVWSRNKKKKRSGRSS